MSKLPPAILAVLKEHNMPEDAVWRHRGKDFLIKHWALEQIAHERGIVFDKPQILNMDAPNETCVLLITGKQKAILREGQNTVHWSFGESSPKNNATAYFVAMAEKRGKDRVILKFLNFRDKVVSELEPDAKTEAPDAGLDTSSLTYQPGHDDK